MSLMITFSSKKKILLQKQIKKKTFMYNSIYTSISGKVQISAISSKK